MAGNQNVPIVGGVVVVTLAATLWWWTIRDRPDASDAEAVAAPLADEPAPMAIEDPDVSVVDRGEALEPVADPAAETLQPSANETAASPAPSPFATTESEDEMTGTATATEARLVPDVASGSTPVADDDASTPRDRVVVPSSYPISDAAKYYVPPDERGPGNLGGPPPLDFPGGPNDTDGPDGSYGPNGSDGPSGPDGPDGPNGGFAPPPAPGQ